MDAQEAKSPHELQLSGYAAWHPSTLASKDDYIEQYGVSVNQVNAICTDAIKNGYIDGLTEELEGVAIDHLCVTAKGRGLLSGPWKIGLGIALAKEISPFLTLLIAVAALVLSIIK